MDVDSIPFGADFRRQLEAAVAQCNVLLAIIGDNWFTSDPQANTRRIDDPADYVRIEIESALRRDIPVIPVLVGSAAMPREHELPDSIKALAYRNNTEIRSGRDLTDHLNRLVQGLHQILPDLTSSHSESTMREQSPGIRFGSMRKDILRAIGFLLGGAFFWSIFFKNEPITYKDLVLLLPTVVSLCGAAKERSVHREEKAKA